MMDSKDVEIKSVVRELLPYQKEPFEKIKKLDSLPERKSILCLKFGYGKTLISLKQIYDTIVEDAKNKVDKKPRLIIAPLHVVSTWVDENKKHFSPPMSYKIVTARETKSTSRELQNICHRELMKVDLVITTYHTVVVAHKRCIKRRLEVLTKIKRNLENECGVMYNSEEAFEEERKLQVQKHEQLQKVNELINKITTKNTLFGSQDGMGCFNFNEELDYISPWWMSFYFFTWEKIVFDEVHEYRNMDSIRHIAGRELNANSYLACSGTLVCNNMQDLKSITYLLKIEPTNGWPSIKTEKKRFTAMVKHYQDKYVVRSRAKEEQEDRYKTCNVMVRVELEDPVERLLYLKVLQAVNEGHNTYRGNTLKIITKLRTICDGGVNLEKDEEIKDILEQTYRNTDVYNPENSSKLKAVLRYIEEVVYPRSIDKNNTAGPEKAIVYVFFISSMETLNKMIRKKFGHKIGIYMVNGSMSAQARTKVRMAFDKERRCAVTIATIQSMNSGVNIESANHVLRVPRWWNPGMTEQCAGRVKRPSQKKSVFVVDFMVRGTVDDSMYAVSLYKKRMLNALMKDEVNENHMEIISSRNAIYKITPGTVESDEEDEIMENLDALDDLNSLKSEGSNNMYNGKLCTSIVRGETSKFLVGMIDKNSIEERDKLALVDKDDLSKSPYFHITRKESVVLDSVLKELHHIMLSPDEYASIPKTQPLDFVKARRICPLVNPRIVQNKFANRNVYNRTSSFSSSRSRFLQKPVLAKRKIISPAPVQKKTIPKPFQKSNFTYVVENDANGNKVEKITKYGSGCVYKSWKPGKLTEDDILRCKKKRKTFPKKNKTLSRWDMVSVPEDVIKRRKAMKSIKLASSMFEQFNS